MYASLIFISYAVARPCAECAAAERFLAANLLRFTGTSHLREAITPTVRLSRPIPTSLPTQSGPKRRDRWVALPHVACPRPWRRGGMLYSRCQTPCKLTEPPCC